MYNKIKIFYVLLGYCLVQVLLLIFYILYSILFEEDSECSTIVFNEFGKLLAAYAFILKRVLE